MRGYHDLAPFAIHTGRPQKMADTKQYPVDAPGVPAEFTVQLDDHDAEALGLIGKRADDEDDDGSEKALTSTPNKAARRPANKTTAK